MIAFAGHCDIGGAPEFMKSHQHALLRAILDKNFPSAIDCIPVIKAMKSIYVHEKLLDVALSHAVKYQKREHEERYNGPGAAGASGDGCNSFTMNQWGLKETRESISKHFDENNLTYLLELAGKRDFVRNGTFVYLIDFGQSIQGIILDEIKKRNHPEGSFALLSQMQLLYPNEREIERAKKRAKKSAEKNA